MSEYRQMMSTIAPSYVRLQDLIEFAIAQRKTAYGWVNGRFYQGYPGGRTIDWTDTIAENKK